MANFIKRIAMASQAAAGAFARTFRDPPQAEGSAESYQTSIVSSRLQKYDRLWGYYQNSAFDALSTAWTAYREASKLYVRIRPLYNPTRRLVDFYAGAIYPGVLSEDAESLPDGVQLAIPLAEDTDPKLKAAIAQFWQWTSWQVGKTLMVRRAGAFGNILIEAFDDLERGKVTARFVDPRYVADLSLDGSGNVKAYVVEYRAIHEDGRVFEFRKEVDGDRFTFYEDSVEVEEYPNPYGFIPAVWVKHQDIGEDFGEPALRTDDPVKINELNSLVSRVHDHIRRVIKSPQILGGSGDIKPLFSKKSTTNSTEEFTSNDLPDDADDSEKLLLLTGPADIKTERLAGNLQLSEVIPYIDRLLGEIEHDYPELSMYQQLRAMGQVTGPAATILIGDTANSVLEAAANYDQASIKLFQMAVAIGGWRMGRGDWERTLQREKFGPFNLDSYAKGQLDFTILPRPLLAQTAATALELEASRLANASTASAFVGPDETLRIAGYEDEKERQKILDDKAKSAPAQSPTLPVNDPTGSNLPA
jgi:hypothetical protein